MSPNFDGFGSRLKARLLHYRIRTLSRRDWCIRHSKIFKLNPGYRRVCPAEIESFHLKLWRQLRPDVGIDTLRVCHGISTIANPEIIPEEVYVSEIEPCLNRYRQVTYIENKNTYNRWFSGEEFPLTFLHNIDGDFYDAQYKLLNSQTLTILLKCLSFPVVLKPSMGPGGGYGVFFPKDILELETRMKGQKNFVVQERIQQHQFFQRYNPFCLNTFRVCTYRSVADNQVHILNISMRMGKGGSLDNETAGGIVCGVMDDGRLNTYAVDKYGTKFLKHPDTGKDFSEREEIPYFDKLIELSCTIAQDIYLARLSSLDLCLDINGKWRIIELNLFNQTIRFSQYTGRPFFGRFTQEVLDYCIEHADWR